MMLPDRHDVHGEKKFSREEAMEILSLFPCCKDEVDFEEFYKGLHVELEHGTRYEKLNITNDDGKRTAMIALAHLMELPDYYTRLEKMEREGKAELENKKKKDILGEGKIIGPKDPDTHDPGDFLVIGL